jgi:hypothetical protein
MTKSRFVQRFQLLFEFWKWTHIDSNKFILIYRRFD